MKDRKLSPIKKYILIIGISIIPAIYSFCYLQAYWNPYGSVDKLPIAVVNSDIGATINGTERNLGSELVERLRTNNSLKCFFVDANQAETGVEGKKYYAVVTIPYDFSSDIASASTTNKHTAYLIFEPNQQHNYIASLLLKTAVKRLEESVRGSINKEITSGLTGKLKAVPENLTTMSNGLTTLSAGGVTLKNGINQAARAQNKLTVGISSLNYGITQAQTGAHQLSVGMSNLSSFTGGINSLDTGLNKILNQFSHGSDSKTITLYDVTQSLKRQITNKNSSTNLHAFISGITNTRTGIPHYIDSSMMLMSVIRSDDAVFTSVYSKFRANPTNPALQTAVVLVTDTSNTAEMIELEPYGITAPIIQKLQAQYYQGGTQAKSYLNLLSKQIVPSTNSHNPTLYDAVTALSAQFSDDSYAGSVTLKSAMERAVSGANQLSSEATSLGKLQSGSKKLSSALEQLKSGSTQLSSGSSTLSPGMHNLQNGATKLSSGLDTVKNSVANSIVSANTKLKSIVGLDRYSEAPVKVKENDVGSVPNYGTGFAPFFISLSLYVGAIMMFFAIYFDSIKRIKILSVDSESTIVRTGLLMLIGVVQAIILGVILQHFLDLKIANLGMYYLSCILFSLVSVSIVQFLIVHIGDLGKLLAILLLIFQLTSGGGIFPIETAPNFYSSFNAYLPITYSIDLFKQSIISYHAKNALNDILVEITYIIIFNMLTIGILIIKFKTRKENVEIQEVKNITSQTN